MRFRPVLVALLTIPFATAPAAAVATGVSHGATSPAGGKQSDPVLPDGIPAGTAVRGPMPRRTTATTSTTHVTRTGASARFFYGTIFWERAGNFNGATHDVWQAGAVTDGAHTVRYHFHNVAWRLTSTGAQYRDAFSEWGNNSCTRRRVRQTTWPHHHTSGHDYYMEIYFHLRDCAVNNPDTPGGMWYSPIYKTKVYHCVDSTGNCYFKGY